MTSQLCVLGAPLPRSSTGTHHALASSARPRPCSCSRIELTSVGAMNSRRQRRRMAAQRLGQRCRLYSMLHGGGGRKEGGGDGAVHKGWQGFGVWGSEGLVFGLRDVRGVCAREAGVFVWACKGWRHRCAHGERRIQRVWWKSTNHSEARGSSRRLGRRTAEACPAAVQVRPLA